MRFAEIWGFVGTAAVLAGCIGGVRPPSVAPVAIGTNVRQERLPSGLSLIVESVPESDVAGLVLVVDAGSNRDPDGKEGLAHWVEHLAFRARHRGEPSLERKLNALVASWNGVTSRDAVAYYAFASKSEFPQLARMLSDLMSEPLAGVTDQVYAHERSVVEAERGFRSDHAPGQVLEWVYQSVFPVGHPYARPVGGTATSIEQLTAGDAGAFVAAHYRPEKMTLFVLAPGDLRAEAVVRAALSRDLSLPRATAPAADSATLLPPLAPGHLRRHSAAIPSPELWLSWPLPIATRADRARAELLANLLASAIRPTFQSQRAVASANCGLDRDKAQALLSCRVLLSDANDVDGVADRLLTELRGQMSRGHDWLTWMQRRFVIERSLDEEEPISRAVGFALSAHLRGDALDGHRLLEDLRKVDVAGVSRVSFAMLRRDNTYLTLIEPLPGATASPSGATGFATPFDGDDGKVDVDTDVGHALASLPPPTLARTRSFRLSNGLTLLVKPVKTRFLSALLGFRGGTRWLPDSAVARAAEAAETWDNVDPDPVTWGIDLRWARNRDEQSEWVRSAGASFQKPLQVLLATKNVVVNWPSHDFRRLRSTLERYDEAPEHRAQRRLLEMLYGAHPYSGYASPAGLETVSLQSIRRFYSGIHRPERGVLIVVGNVDPESVRSYAEEQFGSWRAVEGSELELPPARLVPATKVVDVEHRPASTQADLELSCLLPYKSTQDRAVALVVADVLQPIWRRLRNASGAVYYGASNVESSLSSSLRVRVTTSVANQHLDKALGSVAPLLRLENTNVGVSYFERARRDVIRSVALAYPTTQATALSIYLGWLEQLPFADMDAMPRQIAALSRGEVQQALDACLGRAALSIVGDQPTIEAALHSADIDVTRR